MNKCATTRGIKIFYNHIAIGIYEECDPNTRINKLKS